MLLTCLFLSVFCLHHDTQQCLDCPDFLVCSKKEKKRKGRLKINHKHFLKQGAGFCYRKSLSLKLASNHTGCVLFLNSFSFMVMFYFTWGNGNM